MASHTIFNSDRLAGTLNPAFLVNILITEDMDNGSIVKLSGPAEDEVEAFAIEAPSATSDIRELALLAEPEVMYDERLNNLHDFYNKADTVCRAFLLKPGDEFSLSAEGFDGTPSVGQTVAPSDTYKFTVGVSGFGSIVAQRGELFVIHVA